MTNPHSVYRRFTLVPNNHAKEFIAYYADDRLFCAGSYWHCVEMIDQHLADKNNEGSYTSTSQRNAEAKLALIRNLVNGILPERHTYVTQTIKGILNA